MPAFPFARSSNPGERPAEGDGRLINAYCELKGQKLYYRKCPGITAWGTSTAASNGVRGAITAWDGSVYVAYPGQVWHFPAGGGAATLCGTLTGSDPVTWAFNQRTTGGVLTPDLVVCRSAGGAFTVTPSTVTAYPDPNLPATANSVDFMGGYLLFSCPDTRVFATNLNTTTINALSFAQAQAMADVLNRVMVWQNTAYFMGANHIEPWLNRGLNPFPLQLATSVMQVGLLATDAACGFEPGWGYAPFFVSNHGTVERLAGYSTSTVSTPAVERFIAASNPALIEMACYTFRGHAFVTLTSDQGTWEYDVVESGRQQQPVWHERFSGTYSFASGQFTPSATQWRGSHSVNAAGLWIVGDRTSGNLYKIDPTNFTEAGSTFEWVLESGQLEGFPARITMTDIIAEMALDVSAEALNPPVNISWSKDGGENWASPLQRPLAPLSSLSSNVKKFPPRVNRVGISTQYGLKARFSMTAAVGFSFMGAVTSEAKPGAAA